jgi:hypothetical protein
MIRPAYDAFAIMPIDTRHIPERRSLRFNTIDEILADIDRLADAERLGQLQSLGNWTLGQTLGHLSAWIGYVYDGIPIKIPWPIRLLLRPMKRRMLYKQMRPGLKIPGVPGGTLGTEVIPTEEGVRRCREGLERLKREAPAKPHMFFGKMTHAEWTALQLRHAEVHLSLFKVGG